MGENVVNVWLSLTFIVVCCFQILWFYGVDCLVVVQN
jgi:hypothetical protein